jgi:hypothetical protein
LAVDKIPAQVGKMKFGNNNGVERRNDDIADNNSDEGKH